ncbi:DUF4401 domain-containing protein [Cupriavidus basilensis]|uniref:DUF4401 domain-containing protein n=1 Tax=Cupriavidus basilensis TaxID=68895 RepID=A0ABT6AQG0_9BURK|nr:DUF4401 domain-containing protein [Cupriavidus basilensis]MDF3834855.1 DUF4401 domain-containing protein [Cupriavidus basilensis]
MNSDRLAVQALWQELAARGLVQGQPAPAQARTPWAVRLLMGLAGWLGAVFFLVFLLGSVFVAARDNGAAIAFCGAAMIALAAVLYRRRAGGTALEQFALAISLSGQGLLVYGAGAIYDGSRLLESAAFWGSLALLQAVLYALVPNRLHRFLAALGVWTGVALALHLAMMPGLHHAWQSLSFALGWLAPLALTLLTGFVLAEARLCAAGLYGWIEAAADATLLFALGAAVFVTGIGQPYALLFDADTGRHTGAYWVAGALCGAVLAAFVLAESGRLRLRPAVRLAALLGAILFSALLAGAPAVVAAALALGLALRRGSLPWLGLAIAALGGGFIWYYSALHWTLLIKSATLAGAGLAVLALRMGLTRRDGAGRQA